MSGESESDVGQSSLHPNEYGMISKTSAFILVVWVCVLFGMVIGLCIVIAHLTRTEDQPSVDQPFESSARLTLGTTNRLCTEFEQVDFVCISMEHRKNEYFEHVRKQLQSESLTVSWFPGIDGKRLSLDDFNLARRYRLFFENNIREREAGKTKTDYRGHLGCTVSHLTVISQMRGMTVILEDDVDLTSNFRRKFQNALSAVSAVDPEWEVLMLGWCCSYGDHGACKENDYEPIHPGGVVRLHYWIGGWA